MPSSYTKQRGTAKAQFTEIKTWIENESDNANLSKLKTKLEMLDKDFEKFTKAQEEIEAACDDEAMDTELEERHALEELYCELKSNLLDLIESKRPEQSNVSHNSHACYNEKLDIELPKIKVDVFDGKYEEWFQFHDMFIASVEKRKGLSDAQKFYYLRKHLKGEALQAIGQLKNEDKSYKIAMDRLKFRYAKERLILNAHLKALLSVNNCEGNPNSLRTLADTVTVNVQSVNNLGYESNKLSDAIIVYIASSKLDSRTRELWETKLISLPKDCDDILTTFVNCIDERASTLQAMPPPPPPPLPPLRTYTRTGKEKDDPKAKQTVRTNATSVENPSQTTTYACPLCSKNKEHQLFACPVFKTYTCDQRIDFVQKNNRCFNCMRTGHSAASCRSMKCKECDKPHHTLIHRKSKSTPPEGTPATDEVKSGPKPPPTDSVNANTATIRDAKRVLIATVCVLLESGSGERFPVRAMLDPGAEENFISAKLANQLGLKTRRRPVQMVGLNGAKSNASHETTVKFFSRVSDYSSTTNAIIVPHVTSVSPPSTLCASHVFNIPLTQLADPDFDKPGQIDLLLCAEYYLDIFTDGYVKGNEKCPSMRNTVFGWIISGRTSATNSTTVSVNRCEIARTLEKFWEMEEISVEVLRSVDDEYCEKFYAETVSRDSTGRYTVRLPFKYSAEKLGESRDTALKILNSLRRRLSSSQFESCKAFMDEYLALGHMSPVPPIQNNEPHFYLPYHPVFKQTSITTKTRIVFNGSKPTSTGVSINDILHTGPVLQGRLFCLLIRLRTYIIAICADIAMMYRQVRKHPDDRRFQRILWFDKDFNIQDHELNTVT
ncbi:uncharacterized protein LOC135848177 [Planococcus citri]|uniref:uncharacterized protein LOC135848177 n=1 Tax=Planococcus citri TaxID=170843 RepID=UPI0031F8F903